MRKVLDTRSFRQPDREREGVHVQNLLQVVRSRLLAFLASVNKTRVVDSLQVVLAQRRAEQELLVSRRKHHRVQLT